MKSKTSNDKSVREKLEERVKFFLDRQISKANNNIKKINSNEKSNSPTLKDSFINMKIGKQIIEKTRNKNNNNMNPIYKKVDNISSLSTQIQVVNDPNYSSTKKENQKIHIKKELIKYIEPRVKITNFAKIAPKFYKNGETNSSGNLNASHEITKSEIEMMEIDEKLPLKKLEQYENKRIGSIIDEKFPFHFLIEIQKCYQEISKDLKNNKNKNLDYKVKIAAIYLSILKNEENIIYNLFLYNKDINQFLIRELCIFLTVLYLNDFDEIKNTDILDFYYCINFCHLNFNTKRNIMIREKKEMLLRTNSDASDIEVDKDFYIKNQEEEKNLELYDITRDSDEKDNDDEN